MNWTTVFAAVIAVSAGGEAMASTGELPENRVLAAAIAKGREHRAITDPAEAETYAARITTATYGEAQTGAQLPFHAAADGDRWKVVGSRPMDLGP